MQPCPNKQPPPPQQKTFYLSEICNSISMLAPLTVTIFSLVSDGFTFPKISVLIGWSAHAPSAIAYHLLTAHTHNADIMLRMDQTMQLFAATTNFVAQTHGSLVTPLFICMCTHFALQAGFWDLHKQRTENHYAQARSLIAGAVITSCLPMIFNNKIPQFCTAVTAFLFGAALTRTIQHPLAYTAFHLALAVFAWALV